MADSVSCDYCRATIDIGSGNGLILSVHRNVDDWEWDDDSWWSGRQDVFRYCSQQHAATYLERVELPSIQSPDDEGGEIAALFGCLALVLVGAAGVALMVYGAIQFWHEVLQR